MKKNTNIHNLFLLTLSLVSSTISLYGAHVRRSEVHGLGHEIWSQQEKNKNWEKLVASMKKGDLEGVKDFVPVFINPNEKRDANTSGNFRGTVLELAKYFATELNKNAKPRYNAVLNYVSQHTGSIVRPGPMPAAPVRSLTFAQWKATVLDPNFAELPDSVLQEMFQEYQQQHVSRPAAPPARPIHPAHPARSKSRPAPVPTSRHGSRHHHHRHPAAPEDAKERAAAQATFTVVTANVLNNAPYGATFRHGRDPHTGRPYDKNFYKQFTDDRLALRSKSLNDTLQYYQPDIIALQEYTYQSTVGRQTLNRSPEVNAHVAHNYHVNRQGPGLYLAAKKTTFYLVAQHFHPFRSVQYKADDPNKSWGFVYQQLQPRHTDNPASCIGVITTHIKGGGADRTAQLNEIAQFISQHGNITQWIITGDFNMTPHERELQAWLYHNGFNFIDSGATTSHQGHYQKLDYILTRGLAPQHETTYPWQRDLGNLLQQDVGDLRKNFYSDHAMIIATFPFGQEPKINYDNQAYLYIEGTIRNNNPDMARGYIFNYNPDIYTPNPRTGISILNLIGNRSAGENRSEPWMLLYNDIYRP